MISSCLRQVNIFLGLLDEKSIFTHVFLFQIAFFYVRAEVLQVLLPFCHLLSTNPIVSKWYEKGPWLISSTAFSMKGKIILGMTMRPLSYQLIQRLCQFFCKTHFVNLIFSHISLKYLVYSVIISVSTFQSIVCQSVISSIGQSVSQSASLSFCYVVFYLDCC